MFTYATSAALLRHVGGGATTAINDHSANHSSEWLLTYAMTIGFPRTGKSFSDEMITKRLANLTYVDFIWSENQNETIAATYHVAAGMVRARSGLQQVVMRFIHKHDVYYASIHLLTGSVAHVGGAMYVGVYAVRRQQPHDWSSSADPNAIADLSHGLEFVNDWTFAKSLSNRNRWMYTSGNNIDVNKLIKSLFCMSIYGFTIRESVLRSVASHGHLSWGLENCSQYSVEF